MVKSMKTKKLEKSTLSRGQKEIDHYKKKVKKDKGTSNQ